jgi:CubicO group peptidase (beta-lactamase class C family)
MATALQTSVDRVIGETDFSGVVRVALGGDVPYERASGLADRAHEIPNTPMTRFGIASGTKASRR